MGVTKNDSTMKSEADQAQRKNLEVENQQDKNEKNSTAGKKSNGKDTAEDLQPVRLHYLLQKDIQPSACP